MIIGKRFTFDAAHFLPHYEGKCRNTHGHTWYVDIELEGEVDEHSGMVIDFKDLSKIVNNTLNKLDHRCLNDIIENPTCERLVQYLWFKWQKLFQGNLKRITIQEGEGGYASYES